MIKATADGRDGRTVLMLGLSHANLDKLRADGMKGHIWVSGERMGVPINVMIFAGTDEREMAHVLTESGLIDERTIVNIDPKLKS